MTKAPHSDAVARAALPEVMFIPDVAVALQLGESAARQAVLRGDVGPYVRVGRRLAVLRETFLGTLRSRQLSEAGSIRLLGDVPLHSAPDSGGAP